MFCFILHRKNGQTYRFQRCSTPKLSIIEEQHEEKEEEDEEYFDEYNDTKSTSSWHPSQDDDEEYEWSEFIYDPYESYAWEC